MSGSSTAEKEKPAPISNAMNKIRDSSESSVTNWNRMKIGTRELNEVTDTMRGP